MSEIGSPPGSVLAWKRKRDTKGLPRSRGRRLLRALGLGGGGEQLSPSLPKSEYDDDIDIGDGLGFPSSDHLVSPAPSRPVSELVSVG